MLRRYVIPLLLVLIPLGLSAQEGDRVMGVWLTHDDDCKIRIDKDSADRYNGTIVWFIDHEEKGQITDIKNPNKELRNKPLMGLKLLRNFRFNASANRWDDGTIYDPTSGKSYKSHLKVSEDSSKLMVRGYVGVSLIGREVVWSRIEK